LPYWHSASAICLTIESPLSFAKAQSVLQRNQMPDLEQKEAWILAQERRLATFVAAHVIEKPLLNIWMILIPVIFVYFFYRLNKVANGRKEFARNFMITRQRALEAAFARLKFGQSPDLDELCRMSSAPEATYSEYSAWLKVLLQQYEDLLQAEGDSVEDLIRSVYKTRSNYLLSLNQLNNVEKEFNTALIPYLDASLTDVTPIIKSMEHQSAAYRRQEAERIWGYGHRSDPDVFKRRMR
jgi:hypothetical protein